MAFVKIDNLYKVYSNKALAIDDFNLEIKKNEFVAIIGPSGCGKSTLLRMIAGLEDITYGELMINGKVMNHVHAKDRDISMVFQNYALYPHMTIFQNIAFGLKLRKEKKEMINTKVQEVAELLGLTEYLDKTPSELSGGQRQRVALGRAMVQESSIFLMDEPLSNLDSKLRSKMRIELLNLHKKLEITTIYVTHDQVEAMTMADKIVVINKGVVQQIGTPKELYYNPKNVFVATFIGDPEINLLPAKIEGNNLRINEQYFPLTDKMKSVLENYTEDEVLLGIRPEDIRTENVYLENYSGGIINSKVDLVEMRGDVSIIISRALNHDFYLKIPSYHDYEVNSKIEFVFNMNKAHLFNPETGERL
ncbi:sugar ABC transporter ATP-binding protein [Bacillus cereus]|nr:sugar ABC transporter ATP-binding protein [Bacillus cereus]PGU68936.1 sugar ABC transporter ATP-binding protein [Bacillus cereus]